MFSEAQEIIIDRFKHPQHTGNLEQANLVVEGSNPFCGDEVHLEARLENGKLLALTHRTRACAVCTAAADLLAELLLGLDPLTVAAKEVTDQLGIPLSPTRLKCALLPLETLKEGIKTSLN